MERKMNAEMFVLRSIACLSIALLHALYRVYDADTPWVELVGLLLTFGTPVFVFISQFVLSYAYPDRVPEGFWRKRVKYILLPYIFFGTLYAGLKGVDMASSQGFHFFNPFGIIYGGIYCLATFMAILSLLSFSFMHCTLCFLLTRSDSLPATY
ncbi:acyltransferase family protein [Paenibacillus sp. D2_2]|uniref:acyltransferase family protein n=1 Tax=Paenibacillus sp. D2_2 TaxID=3073092 RepID=UPI0028155356|nr:acyltransferase family protein [Paenibacillus sp. D2_2]WMT42378.1 acyltransferase family protein [Paenibacillus sp. D2_2]